MTNLSTKVRISFGLVCLVVSTLLIGYLVGVMPDEQRVRIEGRTALCEALALDTSIHLSDGGWKKLEALYRAIVARNQELASIGLRRSTGELMAATAEHASGWVATVDGASTLEQVQVPLRIDNHPWGCLEVRFKPLVAGNIVAQWIGSQGRLLAFMGAACLLSFWFYLGRILEYLDPSQSVPRHVRSALDTLAEGLLVVDPRDRIVLANRAMANFIGIPAEKLMGRAASQLAWLRDANSGQALPWMEALKDKAPRTNDILGLKGEGEQPRTFVVNSSPVLGAAGKHHGVLVTFDDVTTLEDKKRELKRAMEAAESANQAKSSFLANMSHEIRTPMNAILGFTDVLRRGLAQNDQERRRFLDTIHSSGEHLLQLLNDILDLSKVEAGRLDVEQIECQPHVVIAEVLQILSVRAAEKGLELRFETDGPIPRSIVSDPLRLRQVLTNLAGNALKFTERGGVSIVARLESRAGEPWLLLNVIDTGCGISGDALDKVFEPFTQADNSVTRRFGGTGLGLTISRRFAEALGGTLSATSTIGQGSCFTLAIPTRSTSDTPLLSAEDFQRESHQHAAATRPAAARRLRSANVLVVDDGDANRQLIGLVLSRAGLQVSLAENGQVALDLAAQQPFDLILMDMQMPVLDGYRATEQLRARGLTIPIIALTGNAMQGDEELCRAAGCSGFLSKPVNLDKLLETLGRELGESPFYDSNPRDVDSSPDASLPASPRPLAERIDSEMDRAESLVAEAVAGGSTAKPRLRSSLPMDDEEFRAIVQAFIVRLAKQMECIEAAWNQRDWPELARLAHWLKGSAGTVGFGALTEPARTLEQLAKAADESALPAALDDLRSWVSAIEAPLPLTASTTQTSISTP